jgi:hypothetical protein
MVISGATVFVFIDLFAPFTAPFGIALALLALKSAAIDEDRRRAWIALLLSCGTVILWFVLMPMYNAMNDGL